MRLDGALAFRDTELLALARAVADHRLVVVTGPPGIGKSLLARAFAQPRRKTGAGAVLVRLDAARTPFEVTHEVARSLGLAVAPATEADGLAERIGRALAGHKRLCLVLDDVDRGRAAVAELVARWRAEAPLVVFLVTSRAKLGVPGEHRFELGPLAVPAADERDAETIGRSPAVQLFVQGAAAAHPGFRLEAADAPTIARIVRQLEGVPLAIDLCASRMLALSAHDIADLLGERLDLLDEPARSLRSAFALSWDELDPDDARLLATCSCFRGGFTLDAACALADAVDAKARVRVARTVERLVDASLVRVDEPARYRIEETLREYAAEKLGPAAEVEARHARHYAALSGARLSLEMLAVERQNLEAALQRSLAAGWPTTAALLLALAPVALARGPLAPFVDDVSAVLAGLAEPSPGRAELRYWRGLARVYQGRRDEALVDLDAARHEAGAVGAARVEALAASKAAVVLGLKGSIAEALAIFAVAGSAAAASRDAFVRGIVAKDRANVLSEAGRNDDAVVELGRALNDFREAGDAREEAFVLMMLGTRFADEGHLGEAERELGGSLALLRQVGDRRTEGWVHAMLALVVAEQGKLSEARHLLDTALVLVRDVGDEQTEGILLGYLGNVALEQGVLRDAERSYRDARVLLARSHDRGSEGVVTACAAVVDLALGRTPAAHDGFARARALLAADGRPARRDAVAILATLLGEAPPGAVENHEESRFARRVVARFAADRARPPVAADDLVIASDGSWLRTGAGTTARLGGSRPIARVLHRLAIERLRHPGRRVPAPALVLAGWPGERVLPAAAKNRLHVTIARLRRIGLEGALLHDADGYFLDPAKAARLAEPDETEAPR